MNIKKVLYDGAKVNDTANIINCRHNDIVKRGHGKFYIHGTDILLFEEDNKVILPGSAFTAMKHFKNLKINVKTPTYNTELGLDNQVSITDSEEKLDSFIYLFAVGVGGCGPESSQKLDVDYTKWIAAGDLVPFRYPVTNADTAVDRTKYFGRKTIAPADRVAYYFKGFETDPEFKQEYVNGSAIDENIYLSDNGNKVESYAEIKLSITPEDCREFFIATTGKNSAKINTISLLTAVPKIIDGYTVYQNIRPITKLNFSTEFLVEDEKGIDIVYQIFY